MMKPKAMVLGLLLVPLSAYSNWQGTVKNDPVTSAKIGIIYTDSSIFENSYRRPKLFVRCTENGPIEIYANMGTYLNNDELEAMASIDGTAAVNITGNNSTDGTAFFFKLNDRAEWISHLVQKTRLSIGVFDYRGTRHNAVFSAIGFTKKFKSVCGWHGTHDVYAK